MWFEKITFFGKQEGIKERPQNNFFSQQLTSEEIELYPDIQKIYPEFIANSNLKIPGCLKIPEELLQLLEYSNGGGIINIDREFGYFSLMDIRYYYFAYGFPKYAPCFLPIAFNGGGDFYAFDFRDEYNVKVVAVSAGDLDYASSVVLGKSLEEVLNKTTNIEDEMYL